MNSTYSKRCNSSRSSRLSHTLTSFRGSAYAGIRCLLLRPRSFSFANGIYNTSLFHLLSCTYPHIHREGCVLCYIVPVLLVISKLNLRPFHFSGLTCVKHSDLLLLVLCSLVLFECGIHFHCNCIHIYTASTFLSRSRCQYTSLSLPDLRTNSTKGQSDR